MGRQDKNAVFHLAGWLLFLACALLFLYAGVRDGDRPLTLASILFLAGCLAFLIPLLSEALTDALKGKDHDAGT